ncbi:hypothetical protein HYV88_01425 [Candidatus Woesearchaeota archaeon]|nr:hypothetical protein [Candidatus Woesearchaeota archaeon]
MKYKAIKLLILFIALVIISSLVYAVGVTGAIGNGVTVIPRQNVEDGKQVVIDRELIVINKNDFRINVTLAVGNEIKEIIQLIDEEFPLEAKQEKRAKFKIILKDNYERSGKINVYFKPNEGNGIVLASKLTILGEDNEEDTNDDQNSEDINKTTENNDNETDNTDKGNVSFKIGGGSGIKKESNFSWGWVILILILIAIIGAVVGFIFLIKK